MQNYAGAITAENLNDIATRHAHDKQTAVAMRFSSQRTSVTPRPGARTRCLLLRRVVYGRSGRIAKSACRCPRFRQAGQRSRYERSEVDSGDKSV